MSAFLCSGQRVWSAGCVPDGILQMRRLHCNEATPQVCAGECEAHLVEAVSALTSLSLTLPIDGMRLLEELRPLPIFCYEARWTMTWSPITVARQGVQAILVMAYQKVTTQNSDGN